MWGRFIFFTGVPAFKDEVVGMTVSFKCLKICQNQLWGKIRKGEENMDQFKMQD